MNKPISRSSFIILYTMICLIWGSTWLAIHIGQEAGMTPFAGVAIRFGVAALIMWVWALLAKTKLPQTSAEWKVILLIGFLANGVSFAVVYWCSQYIPSGLEAVIFGTMPLWTALISHYIFHKDKLSIAKLSGIIIGIIGIGVIFYPQIAGSGTINIAAMLILLIAPIVSGVSTVLTKKYTQEVQPVMMNAISTLTGFIVVGAFALANENVFALEWNSGQVWSLLYLVIFGTIITFVTYFRLMKQASAVIMSYVALITPVIAVILGWAFLHETLGVHDFVGAALVLGGVTISLRAD
jgi:drug/metabolite transporter (DMT)-like permease